jgi:hypothetical protein
MVTWISGVDRLVCRIAGRPNRVQLGNRSPSSRAKGAVARLRPRSSAARIRPADNGNWTGYMPIAISRLIGVPPRVMETPGRVPFGLKPDTPIHHPPIAASRAGKVTTEAKSSVRHLGVVIQVGCPWKAENNLSIFDRKALSHRYQPLPWKRYNGAGIERWGLLCGLAEAWVRQDQQSGDCGGGGHFASPFPATLIHLDTARSATNHTRREIFGVSRPATRLPSYPEGKAASSDRLLPDDAKPRAAQAAAGADTYFREWRTSDFCAVQRLMPHRTPELATVPRPRRGRTQADRRRQHCR